MTAIHFSQKTINTGIIGLFIFVCAITSFGQDRCGTVEYNKVLDKDGSPIEREDQFENWLSKKMVKESKGISTFRMNSEGLIEIPVVVHIIHNGEALGTGINITDAQIQSQIDVLNEDFRRLNADRINTPSAFESVAADIEVEFVMAKRDPEGLATNAITRTLGSQTI